MKFVIDRFENGFAVIELQDGEIVKKLGGIINVISNNRNDESYNER